MADVAVKEWILKVGESANGKVYNCICGEVVSTNEYVYKKQ